MSGSLGSSAAGASAGSSLATLGSGFDTLGTAFSSHATGSNLSGIVPAYFQHAASSIGPGVLEASNANPSVAGSVFSTLGRIFGIKVKFKNNAKNPY